MRRFNDAYRRAIRVTRYELDRRRHIAASAEICIMANALAIS